MRFLTSTTYTFQTPVPVLDETSHLQIQPCNQDNLSILSIVWNSSYECFIGYTRWNISEEYICAYLVVVTQFLFSISCEWFEGAYTPTVRVLVR